MNCQVDPTSLGKLVKFLYPGVNRVLKRVRVDGKSKRMYTYENLNVKPEGASITFGNLPEIISQKGRVFWDDAEKGWVDILLNEKSSKGEEPVKIVIFRQDKSLTVRIGEYEVPLAKLHMPVKYRMNVNNIMAIIESLEVMKICVGFLGFDSKYRRCTKCHLLLSPICATQTCKCCTNRKHNEMYEDYIEPLHMMETDINGGDSFEDIKDILSRVYPEMAESESFIEFMENQRMALGNRRPTSRRKLKR